MTDSVQSLEARKAALEKQAVALRKKLHPIEEEIRRCESSLYHARARERTQQLVGKEVRHSQISGNAKLAWLNDVTGKLVSVGRKRALVDFGEVHGQWRVPFTDVYAADDPHVGMKVYF